jgi:hypothetical protein
MRRTAEDIVLKMGFPDDATGPYVTALRTLVREQVSQGMTNRSGGTWADPAIWNDHEERARCFLEIDWDLKQGYSCRVELLDTAPLMWRYNLRTMRRHIEFRPDLIRPWLADRWRLAAMRWRVWRGRRQVNPYRSV